MTYVDGFVLPVPTDRLDDYKALAEKAAKIWREHGALEYRECVGEDMNPAFGVKFPELAHATPDETVVFAWITYKSREHRDEVNAKVMADPRMNEHCDAANLPFDCARMGYGGFKTLVAA
ncbi:DUF1428 family protein [bacterium]|nr:DUF1428 family protein [bacterium]